TPRCFQPTAVWTRMPPMAVRDPDSTKTRADADEKTEDTRGTGNTPISVGVGEVNAATPRLGCVIAKPQPPVAQSEEPQTPSKSDVAPRQQAHTPDGTNNQHDTARTEDIEAFRETLKHGSGFGGEIVFPKEADTLTASSHPVIPSTTPTPPGSAQAPPTPAYPSSPSFPSRHREPTISRRDTLPVPSLERPPSIPPYFPPPPTRHPAVAPPKPPERRSSSKMRAVVVPPLTTPPPPATPLPPPT